MPVLTCPFTAIPAQEVPVEDVVYPAYKLFSTELTIKPVASEEWNVEGISLQFTLRYFTGYHVKVEAPYKSLVKSKEYLEKSLNFQKASKAFLEQAKLFIEDEKTELRAVEKRAEEINTKEKTLEHEKEVFASKAAIYANAIAIENNKHEIEGVNHEIEATHREIEGVEKELAELGKAQALEGIKTAPLKIVARLYARGNELIWNTDLSPQQFINYQGFFRYGEPESSAFAEWRENINDHEQFNDPLNFTERENLRLTIELVGPPKLSLGEGLSLESETFIKLSQVQAVVNYSRQVAS
jgi:hypothetical protein